MSTRMALLLARQGHTRRTRDGRPPDRWCSLHLILRRAASCGLRRNMARTMQSVVSTRTLPYGSHLLCSHRSCPFGPQSLPQPRTSPYGRRVPRGVPPHAPAAKLAEGEKRTTLRAGNPDPSRLCSGARPRRSLVSGWCCRSLRAVNHMSGGRIIPASRMSPTVRWLFPADGNLSSGAWWTRWVGLLGSRNSSVSDGRTR